MLLKDKIGLKYNDVLEEYLYHKDINSPIKYSIFLEPGKFILKLI